MLNWASDPRWVSTLELLPLDLLRLKRTLLGCRHLAFILLDLTHELGRFRRGDLLTKAEVGPFKGEHLLEMPTLTLAPALSLHGLELGLLLGCLRHFTLIPFGLG